MDAVKVLPALVESFEKIVLVLERPLQLREVTTRVYVLWFSLVVTIFVLVFMPVLTYIGLFINASTNPTDNHKYVLHIALTYLANYRVLVSLICGSNKC